MTDNELPPYRKFSFADYSYAFAKDLRGGRPNPNYRGFRTLFCRNCGQFISELDATQHDEWHRSGEFEKLYRRKAEARPIAPVLNPYKYGRKVA